MRKVNLGHLRSTNPKEATRVKRKIGIRKRLSGDAEAPRLTVFRSARHIYAQLVDDAKGVTLVQACSLDKGLRAALKGKKKADAAKEIGKAVAERAKAKGITTAVFDRNGFRYHGRIAAVADGAREGGLQL
ncbi:MAG: 50S ribosomal protein L18 [Deltaproteobacteria bacterium]|nr:50S ribosomal protein L18 [Deltaproteobacteria bacterium]